MSKEITVTTTMDQLVAAHHVACDAVVSLRHELAHVQVLDPAVYADFIAENVPLLEKRLQRAEAVCDDLAATIVDVEVKNGIDPFQSSVYEELF